MADYGRVAHDQGQAIVIGLAKARVANDQGQAIVVGPVKGRVANDQGQAVVAPIPEFRVATMFVEVWVTLREVAPPTPPVQQGSIRMGLGARSGFRKKNY